MTPFDPAALLAMLLAFYPLVSGAELVRARRERPEYFAGGAIIGRHSDALRLPDGDVWDLIFDVDGLPGVQRWQMIRPGGGAGAGDARFPLEAGPLVPIDLAAWPAPVRDDVFLPLVAGALGDLGDADAWLARAETDVAEGSSPAALEGAFDRHIDGLAGERASVAALLDAADPTDLLRETGALEHTIDAQDRDYDERIDVYFPDVGDPGAAPPDVPGGPDVPQVPILGGAGGGGPIGSVTDAGAKAGPGGA